MNQYVPAPSGNAAASGRAKVFVSYSRKDLPFAQTLVEALGARGFDALLDKTDVAPGEPWKEQRDVARRRPRRGRALARPAAGRCQCADRPAPGFHPGEPASGDGKAAHM